MDTDPNPFRYSPDRERSESPTEAPSDDTRDFAAADSTSGAGGMSGAADPSPMSEDHNQDQEDGSDNAGASESE